MTDVRLFHTDSGGEIDFINGQAVLADGLETAAYLSLFGGAEQDSGSKGDERRQWWGNLGENDPAKTYRSETQYLLRSIPAVPANLRRIEDTALRDLGWLMDGIASAITTQAGLVAPNRVTITIEVTVNDSRFRFAFTEAWRAQNR